MKEKKNVERKISPHRKWLLIFTPILSVVIGWSIVYGVYTIGLLMGHPKYTFIELWEYSNSVRLIMIISTTTWIFTSAYILIKWKTVGLGNKKNRGIPKDLLGDARWMREEEKVLKYDVAFFNELEGIDIDGIPMKHVWIRQKNVPKLKEKLRELRALKNRTSKISKKVISEAISKLKILSDKKIINQEEIAELLALKADEEWAILSRKLLNYDLKGKKQSIEDGRYHLINSPEAKANIIATNDPMVKASYFKSLKAYEAGDLQTFNELYAEIENEFLTERDWNEVKKEAKRILKKGDWRDHKELKAVLKRQLKEQDAVSIERTLDNALRIISVEVSRKEISEKQAEKKINSLAKEIANDIKKYSVEIEKDGTGMPIKPIYKDLEMLSYYAVSGLHTVVIGSTGAGKTVTTIKPAIDSFAESASKPSIIISDPKGELFKEKSKYLKAKGYDIISLNFRDIKNTTRWNPLTIIFDNFKEYVKAEMAEDIAGSGKYSDLVDNDMEELAKSIFPETGGKDSFWNESAINILKGGIWLYFEIWKEEFYKAKHENREIIFDEKKINLSSVNQTLLLDVSKLDDWIEGTGREEYGMIPRKESRVNEYLRAWLDGLAGQNTSTSDSMTATYTNKMKIFTQGAVKSLTSQTDIKLGNIGTRPTAVFMIIPDETSGMDFFGTLFVSQSYQALVREANKHNGKLPVSVHYLLDEFGNFPKINNFDTIITVARGRNIKFTLIIQSYSQLEAVYGREVATTLKGNLDTTIYLLTTDTNTSKEISERVGKTTIITDTTSKSSGGKGPGSTSKSQRIDGNPLILPQQLERQEFGTGVVLSSRSFAAKTQFVPYFYDPGVIKREKQGGEVKLTNAVVAPATWNQSYHLNLAKHYKDIIFNEVLQKLNELNTEENLDQGVTLSKDEIENVASGLVKGDVISVPNNLIYTLRMRAKRLAVAEAKREAKAKVEDVKSNREELIKSEDYKEVSEIVGDFTKGHPDLGGNDE